MITAQAIRNYGKKSGVDEIRITSARPFTEVSQRINEQIKNHLYLDSEHWHRRSVQKFCDVHSRLPDAKSIVAGCLCYLTDEPEDYTQPGKPHGLVARYTWRNHYLELKKRLHKLARFLQKEYRASYRVYSNGPIAEKPIAQRSGLGYYGKHSIIMNPVYGSWIVLGEIVTDIEIEPDKPLNIDCGKCKKCIEACPTKAITSPYIIDRRRCIQALTNWPGIIPEDILRVWSNRLYGCTTCQEVCPVNKKVKALEPRTKLGDVGSSLPLMEILGMDEQEYRSRYANNQLSRTWINFKAIQRNALVALGYLRDKTTLSVIKSFIKDDDEMLAKTSQWALDQF